MSLRKHAYVKCNVYHDFTLTRLYDMYTIQPQF